MLSSTAIGKEEWALESKQNRACSLRVPLGTSAIEAHKAWDSGCRRVCVCVCVCLWWWWWWSVSEWCWERTSLCTDALNIVLNDQWLCHMLIIFVNLKYSVWKSDSITAVNLLCTYRLMFLHLHLIHSCLPILSILFYLLPCCVSRWPALAPWVSWCVHPAEVAMNVKLIINSCHLAAEN